MCLCDAELCVADTHTHSNHTTGPPLFDWIVDHGVFFREETASTCLSQIVKSIYYIHSNGVCHNDMKPENIIVGVTRARYGGDGNPDDMEGVGGGVGIEGESGNFQKSELCLKVSVKKKFF